LAWKLPAFRQASVVDETVCSNGEQDVEVVVAIIVDVERGRLLVVSDQSGVGSFNWKLDVYQYKK
jgi:hypothetical protein